MLNSETREINAETKKGGIIALCKKHRKALLIGIAIVFIIILVCVLPGIIHNAIFTNRVQSNFDGKSFVHTGKIYTSVYVFNENTMGMEYWCSSDKSSSGDINERFRYKVKGSLGSNELDLWYKEDGHWWCIPGYILCKDGSIEFVNPGEWRQTTSDEIDTLRKEILCKHEFGQDITITTATCIHGGEISHTCIKCGYTETQSTVALDHNYKNKVCTECGAEKQPEKAYDVEPNTWYTYQDVLHFQNIKLQNAFSVSQGKGMMVSYYFVCQHCHVVDETLQQNVPEFSYDINKMFPCEECGGLTTVKIELG